jgi:uncharacterized protein
MESAVKIVENEGVSLLSPVVIEGLPDVGLVGVIGTLHLAESLKLVEIAHLESNLFPPVMVMHKGMLVDPVRILGNQEMVVVTSEIAIPPRAIYPLAEELVDWIKEKGARLVISLTGIPEPNRLEIEKPLVFGVGSSPFSMTLLKDNQVEVMEEGFIAGIYALVMKQCLKRNIPSLTLMAQAFPNLPDPGAAAIVLEILNKILKINVGVEELLEKADEIRVKGRDLMKQTGSSMQEMGKMSEQEIPVMYR